MALTGDVKIAKKKARKIRNREDFNLLDPQIKQIILNLVKPLMPTKTFQQINRRTGYLETIQVPDRESLSDEEFYRLIRKIK